MPCHLTSLKYYLLTLLSLCMILNTATAQETEGEETPPSFSGIVVDYDTGEPIKGATISWMKMVGMEENKHYGETLFEVQSGQDGHFTLEGVQYPPKDQSLFGFRFIHLKASGYESVIFLQHSMKDKSPTLPLHQRNTISGQVLDTEGQPIASALIGDVLFCSPAEKDWKDEQVLLYPSCWTFTDQQGNFQLEGVRKGLTPFLRVVANGYQPTFSEEIDPSQNQTVTITLEKGVVTLTGNVLDHDGTPLPNRTVNVQSQQEFKNGTSKRRPKTEPITIKTNDQGTFTITNLIPKNLSVRIDRYEKLEDHYLGSKSFSKSFSTVGTVHHDFKFLPPIQVTGKVIHGDTSQGIPNLTISTRQAKETHTDQSGTFILDVYKEDLNRFGTTINYTIPFGYTDSSNQLDNASYRLTDEDIEEHKEIEIKLFPTSETYHQVQLTPITPDGKPFPGITPVTIGRVIDNKASLKSYPSNKDGVISLSVYANSTYFIKRINNRRKDDNAPTYYYGYVDIGSEPKEVTAKLSPVYKLKGRIITEEGEPIPHFGLKLTSKSEPITNNFEQEKSHQEYFNSTNQNGEFQFQSIIPGEITIFHKNFHTPLEFHYSTTIEPGQPTDLGDLVVKTGKGISLQFIKAADVKIPAYRFQCFDGDQELKYHTLNHGDYRYTLTGFKKTKGPLKVIISPTNFETVTFESVELGTKDLKVNLVPVPTYSLKVIDEVTGEDITYINHKFEKYHDRMKQYRYTRYSYNAEESPVCLGVLEPGKYRVLAAGMTKGEGYVHDKKFDGRIGYTYFTVEEGDPVQEIIVPVSSDYGMEVKGSAILTNGFGTLAGGKVYLNKSQTFQPSRSRSKSPFGDKETTIDSNGCFVFPKVLPGTYYLHFIKDEYIQKEEVKVTVEENTSPAPQEILVYTTGKFQGKVTGLDNRLNLSLRLLNKDNHKQYSYTHTKTKGHFVFDNPFPGESILSCSSGAHPCLINDTITITPGETVERTYDLSDTVLITSKLRIDGKQLKFACKKDDLDNLYTQVDYPHNDPYPEGFEPPTDKYLVPPGQYMLLYQGQMNYRSPIEFITIPGAEPIYNLEMDITSIPVNIAFDCEGYIGSSNGDVSLQFSGTTIDRDLFEGDIVLYNSKPLKLKFFKTGTYTFSGKLNYKYKIDSGPIEIKKGENNITLKVIEMTPEEMEEYKQEQLEKRRKRQEGRKR